jgi:hypothetical protein
LGYKDNASWGAKIMHLGTMKFCMPLSMCTTVQMVALAWEMELVAAKDIHLKVIGVNEDIRLMKALLELCLQCGRNDV